jgi:two-component system chemotaxis response regulator CheY
MPTEKGLAAKFMSTKVLVVDDEYYMRKEVRTLLMSIGERTISEAQDGPAGLEAIRTLAPDVVIVDWQMPGLDGAGFVRMVRSPGTFPYPDIPIIMLTGHGERSRVVEAVSVGVNEFLLKPVSSKSLQDRLVAVLTRPRPMIQHGNYYGPAPRKMVSIHADGDNAVANLVLVN